MQHKLMWLHSGSFINHRQFPRHTVIKNQNLWTAAGMWTGCLQETCTHKTEEAENDDEIMFSNIFILFIITLSIGTLCSKLYAVVFFFISCRIVL